jgi:hypothetical protein
MVDRRGRQILALIAISVVGVGFGIWLLHAGLTILGCLWTPNLILIN